MYLIKASGFIPSKEPANLLKSRDAKLQTYRVRGLNTARTPRWLIYLLLSEKQAHSQPV